MASSRSLLERTVVVVVGDHGESLGEHSEGTHGLFVYDATVRVPLVIRAPHKAPPGARVPAVVRSQDVMPTVLALAGVDAPTSVRGRSLVALMTGMSKDPELDAYSESFYALNHFGWAAPRSLRAGRYKVIDLPRPELYDLNQDPGEQANLFEDRRALADRLLQQLSKIDAHQGAVSQPATVDPETRARLAALGYVSSSPAAQSRPSGALPDPKDKIGVFNSLFRLRIGRRRRPWRRFARIVKADPQIIDAWTMLGNEHFRRGEICRRGGLVQEGAEPEI